MDRKPGHLPRDVSSIPSELVWIKLVGIGNTNVGKTCLIKHFCESKTHWDVIFSQFSSGYQPTVGVDYGFKIQSVSGQDLRVHLWDLSGGAEFVDVRNELYGGTDAVFLVFDVCNTSSFDSLDQWLLELSKYCNSNIQICLVGNKVDNRTKRTVSGSEARKFAQQHKMTYYETSCSSGEGVEKMFHNLLEATLKSKSQN